MHFGIERAVPGRDQAGAESFYYDGIGSQISARKRGVDFLPALLRRQRVESCQQKLVASFPWTDQTQDAIELLVRVQPLRHFKFRFRAPTRDDLVIDHRR